jgi:hypothetical protein
MPQNNVFLALLKPKLGWHGFLPSKIKKCTMHTVITHTMKVDHQEGTFLYKHDCLMQRNIITASVQEFHYMLCVATCGNLEVPNTL